MCIRDSHQTEQADDRECQTHAPADQRKAPQAEKAVDDCALGLAGRIQDFDALANAIGLSLIHI